MGLLDNVSKEVNSRDPMSKSIASFMKEMRDYPIRESVLGDDDDDITEKDLDSDDIAYLNSIGEDTEDDEYGFEKEDGEESEATEGYNMDTAMAIYDKRVKEARQLIKDAKAFKKKKQYIEGIGALKSARALIVEMKNYVDNMDEPASGWQKFGSWFTPIFTLMPSKKLSGFSIIPRYSRDGIKFDVNLKFVTYTDTLSETTGSKVKQNLQYKFNLFLNNVDIYIKLYEQLSNKTKNATNSSSAIESNFSFENTDFENEVSLLGYERLAIECDGTIPEQDEYPEVTEPTDSDDDNDDLPDDEFGAEPEPENSGSILASMSSFLEDEGADALSDDEEEEENDD